MTERVKYLRKIIRIKATDSPNVRLALIQQSRGEEPTAEELIPGVISWEEYQARRRIWDQVRQCIGLDAEFYQGAELLLFPPEWLNYGEILAKRGGNRSRRRAHGVGVDTAEGGNNTTWTAVDRQGILKQVSKLTPNTAKIVDDSVAFCREVGVPWGRVCFDEGGGGKQIADFMRELPIDGIDEVRTIPFGANVTPELRHGKVQLEERKEVRETSYVYLNRRTQMYHEASHLFDLSINPEGFAFPEEFRELRRQLAVMPKMVDKEGRFKMPPKRRNTLNSKEKTLIDILGCSPDEADSFVLAVHGMLHEEYTAIADAF